MLKRKDLVDQFSLVVKQEIKNHQDASLAMNVAINSNREQIDNLSALFSKKIAFIESELSKQKMLADVFKKELFDEREKNKKLHKETSSFLKKSISSFSGLFASFEDMKTELSKLSENVKYLFDLDIKKEDLVHDLYKYVNQENYKIENKIKNSVANAKNEILNRPSEVNEMKEELLERLASCKIEKDGVDRELAVLKKSVYVLKKELEHVYNLMDRLKV